MAFTRICFLCFCKFALTETGALTNKSIHDEEKKKCRNSWIEILTNVLLGGFKKNIAEIFKKRFNLMTQKM